MRPGNDTDEMSQAPARGRNWRTIKIVLGIVFAVFCLIWVFHDIHVRTIVQQLGAIKWDWVILAIVIDSLSYVAQAIRWKLVLKPLGELSTLRATQAIYIGLFTSEFIPLRMGEVVRAYLVSNWLRVDMVAAIPAQVIERLFDGIWLMLGIGATALLVDLPRNLVNAAKIFGVVILLFTAVFIYLLIRKEQALEHLGSKESAGKGSGHALAQNISRAAAGIRQIGLSRHFITAFLVSFFVLGFQLLAFWVVLRAYDLNLSLWNGGAVFLILALGIMIPNVPSNVGPYQLFCVLGLSLFGIDKTTASGFSAIVFVVLTVPIVVIGFAAITGTGLNLKRIRTEVAGRMRPGNK